MEIGVFNLQGWISLEELVKTKIEDFSIEEGKTYTIASLGVGEVYAANVEDKPADSDIVGDYIPNNGYIYNYKKEKELKNSLFLKAIGNGLVRIDELSE